MLKLRGYCIMVCIPNGIFSKLLYRYPDLWALDRRHVCWEIAGREFADRLSNKLNQRVTTDDVKHKLLLIKASLKKLDKKPGTARTTLCAYLWYAHKLGLKRTANRLTKQLISDGEIKIKQKREEMTPQVESRTKGHLFNWQTVPEQRAQTDITNIMLKTAEPITPLMPISSLAKKTPITTVANSGAELPAAMKVAPATFGDNFNSVHKKRKLIVTLKKTFFGVFKSRQRDLFCNLMRPVKPRNECQSIREKILVNELEKLKDLVIPANRLLGVQHSGGKKYGCNTNIVSIADGHAVLAENWCKKDCQPFERYDDFLKEVETLEENECMVDMHAMPLRGRCLSEAG
uniref:Uncharacterized protein n=1 Tax=Glossina austeni TaxID=7395 RepID=A0A1A9UI35_GLOAU